MPYIEIESRESGSEQRIFGYEIVDQSSFKYEESEPAFEEGEEVNIHFVGDGLSENYTGVVEIEDSHPRPIVTLVTEIDR